MSVAGTIYDYVFNRLSESHYGRDRILRSRSTCAAGGKRTVYYGCTDSLCENYRLGRNSLEFTVFYPPTIFCVHCRDTDQISVPIAIYGSIAVQKHTAFKINVGFKGRRLLTLYG